MRLINAILFAVLLALVTSTAFAQDEPATDPSAEPAAGRAQAPGAQRPAEQPPVKEPSREELEKQFAETMTGATLVGHFTMDGRGNGQPKEEKYTIVRVTKQRGDHWLFLARMQFGGRDVTVPMLIPVKWAGDTAVISVTDLGIPGLGTYSARVLIYQGQYAGTWSGKDHGGHLWGRVERTPAAEGAAGGGAAEGAEDKKERP